MILLWHFYWPLLAAALAIGVLVGRIGFFLPKIADDAPADRKAIAEAAYRAKRKKLLTAGLAAVLLCVGLWHWPLGAGSRFAGTIEGIAQAEIRELEMPEIAARAERAPIGRALVMSGPANDLQQQEFVRMMKSIPGVARVYWAGQSAGLRLPLAAEAALLSLTAFLLGTLFSFLVEVRRRVNAEWSW